MNRLPFLINETNYHGKCIPECDIHKSNDTMHVIKDVEVRKTWFAIVSTKV
jgi:hypothetical protein